MSRPRLLARLEAGLTGPLTVIAAPAGFGKTTVLAAWLSRPEAGDRTVGWFALDAGDSDPLRFLRYLIAALQTITPDIGSTTLNLLRAAQAPPLETLLPFLINDLSTLPERSILVLDDYHVIDSLAVHRGLVFLVEHLPLQLHLVIASRVEPPLPLARLRARGQLSELRAHDLRFTSEEVEMFLREVMDLPLTMEDVAALEARTEGWIAGLHLAALSLRDRSRKQQAEFVEAFTGSHRFVVDYLVDEVVMHLPQHLQTFVLQTSILGRLRGPLCDAVVLGETSAAPAAGGMGEQAYSQAVLEELERRNLFIVPMDDARHWYRYHHLFAQVLRERLVSGAVRDVVAALHRRASAWFEQQGLSVEAVQHALEAQDWERAARLIEQQGQVLLARGQQQTVLGWINSLPEMVARARPFLNVVYAGALFNVNQLEEAELRLRMAEQCLTANIPAQEHNAVLGTVLLTRAYIALFCGDLTRWLALSCEASQILPDTETMARRACRLDMASAFLVHGDVSPANERCLVAAIAPIRDYGDKLKLVRGIVTLAALQRRQGRLRQAAASYRASADIAPDLLRVQALISGANYYFGLGELLLEWTDLDAAEGLLEQGREMVRGKRLTEAGAVVLGYSALARLRQARGEGRGACAVLDELQAVEHERNFGPQLLARAAAARAHLALLQGDLPAAVQWASGSGLRVDDELTYQREPEYLTLARVRIAQGRNDPAGPYLAETLHLLDRLRLAAETGERMDSVIEILTLRALALQAQSILPDALRILERALILARPEGYVRIFVDEGAPMAVLLAQALGTLGSVAGDGEQAKELRTYAQRLLGVLRMEGVEPAGIGLPMRHHNHPDGGVEPLSERELEVLRLLAHGRSNQAIAEELIVAVGTVKRHVNSILGKLQVQSRLQAVARARELDLV